MDFYDRGGDFDNPFKTLLIQPLGLTSEEKADLLVFLRRPLTDPRVAAASPPFDEPTLYGESNRVPQMLAGGVPGITRSDTECQPMIWAPRSAASRAYCQ